MLSAVNKENSSLNVNSGFPHLTNTQQPQQSGTFTISCQMTVIFLGSLENMVYGAHMEQYVHSVWHAPKVPKIFSHD